MSALHKLSWAVLAVLGGMEVVVLDAVPSPVHDDLTTMAYCTVGALVLGLGVAFALGTAFATGRDGKHRRDDSVAAPNGIPPWADEHDTMRTRPETQAPKPARPADGPAAVTLVDMAGDADTRETPVYRRNWTIADHWAHYDETNGQVPGDDTHLMQFGELAALLNAEPEPLDDADVPPSQRDYTVVTTHLQGVAEHLTNPAAWDMWSWRAAA